MAKRGKAHPSAPMKAVPGNAKYPCHNDSLAPDPADSVPTRSPNSRDGSSHGMRMVEIGTFAKVARPMVMAAAVMPKQHTDIGVAAGRTENRDRLIRRSRGPRSRGFGRLTLAIVDVNLQTRHGHIGVRAVILQSKTCLPTISRKKETEHSSTFTFLGSRTNL